jgi:hypothetical protein
MRLNTSAFRERGSLVDKRWALHHKKSCSIFPSPAGMSLTKLSLIGNYDTIYKLFLPREILVSDIPAGLRNIEKLFLQCSPQILALLAGFKRVFKEGSSKVY